MNEMIERVARAICGKRCVLGEKFGQPCVDESGRNARCRAEEIHLRYTAGIWDGAKAAIEAMREEDLAAELSWRKFSRLYTHREDGCWIWQGPIDRRDGYGRFYDGSGKTKGAYRYAYEHVNGAVPEGLVVDHICGNRLCVNPGHLRVVTNAENVLCGNGITAQYAKATQCKRGHEMDEANTYVRPDGLRMCRICQLERSRQHKARKRAMIDEALRS